MFDAAKFLDSYAIPFFTEGKNVSPGWTNINCPFCEDPSNHGGFSPSDYFNCWRCGRHSLIDTICAILNCTFQKGNKLLTEYTSHLIIKKEKEKKIVQAKQVIFPAGTTDLDNTHYNYLRGRGFNPHKIEHLYKLKAGGVFGSHKFRIIAPIFYNRQLVSYIGRSTNENSSLRYKTCKKGDEVVFHKHILYNLDRANTEFAVVVEGITDVWRLGRGAVATFGINFHQQQVALLAERFTKIFVLFDAHDEAQEQAEKLAYSLSILDKRVEIVELQGGDPGNLS